jgi:thioredoxin reductase
LQAHPLAYLALVAYPAATIEIGNICGMESESDPVVDVLIVGGGPAGLNAALVLGRGRRRVVLCDDGKPRNAPATEMHGFITRDGYSPRALTSSAREDLAPYETVEIVDERVTQLDRDGTFVARLERGRIVRARRVVLATGMRDDLPRIAGIAERWGRSVFVCPHCDGWEFRDRRIGVFGAPADSVGLAQELHRWSAHLVAFGLDPQTLDRERGAWIRAAGVTCEVSAPVALMGDEGKLDTVVLADGTRVPCDVLFLCTALVQRSDLPTGLGCALTADGHVAVDGDHRTSVDGVYACGDMCTPIHQVVVAAADGARTAIAVDDAIVDDEIARTVAAVRS